MNETIKGTVKELLEVQSGTSKAGKDWKKQVFIVSNNEGYEGKEQIFAFEMFGTEKVDNLSKYNKVGDKVEVSFNIQTNEYNGKYYTSLQAWKVMSATPQEIVAEGDDDLPF